MLSQKVNKVSGIWKISILGLVLIASLACAIGPFSRQGDQLSVTVRLSEQNLNQLITNATTTSNVDDNLFEDVSSVDLQDGIVRVYGTYRKPDGSTVEGSYDFELASENGDLKAEIVAVDVEGLSLEDPRVESLNRRIESELAKAARQNEDKVEFSRVEISDDEVIITVSVDVND